MLVLGDTEDRHALRVAARDPDIPHGGADHLALVGDQHQLLARLSREAGHDAAVALGRVDVGDALAAAVGAAILVGRRALAVAILGDGQDELLLLGQFGDAVGGKRAFAVLLARHGGSGDRPRAPPGVVPTRCRIDMEITWSPASKADAANAGRRARLELANIGRP